MRLAPSAIAVLGVACLLAGCADEETTSAPPTIAQPAKRAASVVDRLEQALRAREYATICDELFTPTARARAGGRRCAAELAADARDLRRPQVRPLSIRIAGPRADVRIRSRVAGQRAVEETLRLERSGGTYRISALER
jgi:hypothetical protein